MVDTLYFEKQFGNLCGVHCLNNALQSRMFDEVILARIGQQLDEIERQFRAQGGVDTPEYLDYMSRPSANYDDTGYFSVQVMQKALKDICDISMDYFTNQSDEVQKDPCKQRLFITWSKNHWACLRNFRGQWVDLNSLNAKPKVMSNIYLAMYVEEFKKDGSLFIVSGDLPLCPGDTSTEFDLPVNKYNVVEVLGGSAKPEDDEEGLTPAQLMRRKREKLLKSVEPKMAGMNLD